MNNGVVPNFERKSAHKKFCGVPGSLPGLKNCMLQTVELSVHLLLIRGRGIEKSRSLSLRVTYVVRARKRHAS
jgi:hypothetical protein